ncbi:MAG: 3,4-dihydroxy-2-butanone-4-phosphate synthase [Bacteroidota bacterium]
MLNTIEEAIADLKLGKVIIVVDDENRENEGDFIIPARQVTPEVINFMSKYGRGLICAALTEERCKELDLDLMVSKNTDPNKTAFTVSVDLLGNGCTTGISAHDRAKTIQALIDPKTLPHDLGRPGHIFPLIAKKGGVIRRTGHTEATVDLSVLAGFEPAGALVEIMNDDGTMARLPQLLEIAKEFDLIISIENLVAFRLKEETLIQKETEEFVQWQGLPLRIRTYLSDNGTRTHTALAFGEWSELDEVFVRVQSGVSHQDVVKLMLNKHDSLQFTMKKIQECFKGLLVLLHAGADTMKDVKDFGIGAQIVRAEGVKKMALITNNHIKRSGLEGYGLEVTQFIQFETI